MTKHVKKDHGSTPTTNAARRIRIFPNHADKATLRQWFGCYRAIYNATVDYANEHRVYAYPTLRPILSNEDNLPADKPWLKKLAAKSRKLAVKDACDAFGSNFAKRKKDKSHVFDVSRRTKKSKVQHLKFEIESLTTQGDGISKTLRLYKMSALSVEGFRYDSRNVDVTAFTRDAILEMDSLGRFSLIMPYYRPIVDNQDAGARGQCALDPGVRTFQTTYSPDGTAYKLGDEAATRIYRLMLLVDSLCGVHERRVRPDGSKMSKIERRRLKQKIARIQNRINNLTDELHWKVANFLVARYSTIVIPPFESSKMSARYDASRSRRRRIGKKTVRQMLRLRHFTFRQRLVYLAKVHGVDVVVAGEEYTSKTCTNCGNIHGSLGGAKEYRCSACGIRYDRDGGGSRNIFIKNLEF